MHLSLDGIGLSLGGKSILDDVSFSVSNGEFVSLLGESGAGKSTILKIVSGLMPQDCGTVSFDGEIVDDCPRINAAQLSCSRIFACFPT